jgi:integrase
MSSLLARGQRLYAKIQNADGEWKRLRTPFAKGNDLAALEWIRQLEIEVERERNAKGGVVGPLTVLIYFDRWIAKQTHATKKDDDTRIRKHAIPVIGHLPMRDVRRRHLRDLIMALRDAGDLAPKTIREVSGALHKMFKSAVTNEVIDSNPVEYDAGVLPKRVDKDPSWRRQAIYTRGEIEQLISDERVPIDRRVFYALKFFTGRHSEVACLAWEHWDRATKPLGALALDDTKMDVPRLIPVHPTLAKILTWWFSVGWKEKYGRDPLPTDLIVPTKIGTQRTANEAQRQLVYDLGRIGLRVRAGKERNRRGHDLRRTLITLARSDGAIDSLLRWVTHGPKPSEILDVYTTPPWEDLCREVAKLKIRGPRVVQGSKARDTAKEKVRPRRDSNPEKSLLGVILYPSFRTPSAIAEVASRSLGPSRGPTSTIARDLAESSEDWSIRMLALGAMARGLRLELAAA